VVPEYVPAAPTRVRKPFHRAGWVYEEKVDGWRILAYKDRDWVRLVSRNGVDHTRRFLTRRFLGIAAAIAKLSARTLVLDGEIAIYDQQLRSRFDWLREPDPTAVATPPPAVLVQAARVRIHGSDGRRGPASSARAGKGSGRAAACRPRWPRPLRHDGRPLRFGRPWYVRCWRGGTTGRTPSRGTLSPGRCASAARRGTEG
jgi:hypothetical protein